MNKNDFITFRFLSSIYLKAKEKKSKYLDVKIKNLQTQIKSQKKLIEQKKYSISGLMEENTSIKKNHNDMIKLFENKTLTIPNNNYDICPLENVFIKKESSCYIIETEKKQTIYVFSENMTASIEYFLTLKYSIIVLSVDRNKIVLQFMQHSKK